MQLARWVTYQKKKKKKVWGPGSTGSANGNRYIYIYWVLPCRKKIRMCRSTGTGDIAIPLSPHTVRLCSVSQTLLFATLGIRSLGAEDLLWLDGVVRLVGSAGRCMYVNFTLRFFFVDFFFFFTMVSTLGLLRRRAVACEVVGRWPPCPAPTDTPV